jgi:hypothetical protein
MIASNASEVTMKRFAYASALAGTLMVAPALAADQVADPDLAQFRAAYTSGDGLAYVVINDANGEHVYRYGDASRSTAKKDTRGYMLFTCNAPHVFIPQKAEDKVALTKATVVKPSDPRFAELDAKYLSGCHNPMVKSAIPSKQSSRQ